MWQETIKNGKYLYLMTPENELLALAAAWDQAMESNDVEQISRFVSPDWIIVGTEGGITSGDAFLGWIRSGDLTHSVMQSDEIQVKIYGQTGIVTARGTSAGLWQGQPFHLYEWSTSVFIRKEGNWACVHTMLTPANH